MSKVLYTRALLLLLLGIAAIAVLSPQPLSASSLDVRVVPWQLTTLSTGNTYYVSPSGSDSNPGTIDRPWKRIQKATSTLVAGDTVLIRGGTYDVQTQDEPIQPANSGTPTDYITFKAYPNEQVIIQGHYPTVGDWPFDGFRIAGNSYIIIEGLTIRGFHAGIKCEAPGHHVIARYNTLEFNSEEGFSAVNKVSGTLEACDFVAVEKNIIHDNGYYADGTPATRQYEGWGSGISLNADGTPYIFDTDFSYFHNILRDNKIYHNYDGTGGVVGGGKTHTDGNGIILDMGGNFPPTLIENNIIFDNGGACIHIYGSQNAWIVGNTCNQNQTDTHFIAADDQRGEISAVYLSSPYIQPKNIRIKNNVVRARSDRLVNFFVKPDTTTLTIENNLWYGGQVRQTYSITGLNALLTDPLFLNASADAQTADLRLAASSPALDSGSATFGMSNVQTTDFNDIARPQGIGYDRGAFENPASYQGTVTPSPTATRTATSTLIPPTATRTATATLLPLTATRTATVTLVPSNTPVSTGTPPACTVTPPKPTLVSPARGAQSNTRSVLLDWEAANCATTYRVMVKQDSKSGPRVLNGGNLTATQYQTSNLTAGKKYLWRVQACNVTKCVWSNWSNFTVAGNAAFDSSHSHPLI